MLLMVPTGETIPRHVTGVSPRPDRPSNRPARRPRVAKGRPRGRPRGRPEGQGAAKRPPRHATAVRRILGLGGSRETLSSTRTRLSQTGASYYLMFAGLISCGQGGANGRQGMPSGHGGVARGCQGTARRRPGSQGGARGRQGGAGGHADSQKDMQADLQWGRMSPLPPHRILASGMLRPRDNFLRGSGFCS